MNSQFESYSWRRELHPAAFLFPEEILNRPISSRLYMLALQKVLSVSRQILLTSKFLVGYSLFLTPSSHSPMRYALLVLSGVEVCPLLISQQSLSQSH